MLLGVNWETVPTDEHLPREKAERPPSAGSGPPPGQRRGGRPGRPRALGGPAADPHRSVEGAGGRSYFERERPPLSRLCQALQRPPFLFFCCESNNTKGTQTKERFFNGGNRNAFSPLGPWKTTRGSATVPRKEVPPKIRKRSEWSI